MELLVHDRVFRFLGWGRGGVVPGCCDACGLLQGRVRVCVRVRERAHGDGHALCVSIRLVQVWERCDAARHALVVQQLRSRMTIGNLVDLMLELWVNCEGVHGQFGAVWWTRRRSHKAWDMLLLLLLCRWVPVPVWGRRERSDAATELKVLLLCLHALVWTRLGNIWSHVVRRRMVWQKIVRGEEVWPPRTRASHLRVIGETQVLEWRRFISPESPHDLRFIGECKRWRAILGEHELYLLAF